MNKILLFLLFGTLLLTHADQNSKKYVNCLKKYSIKISQGDAKAFKNYIFECKIMPSNSLLSLYMDNSYKELDPQSLVCLGDLEYNRLNQRKMFSSFFFYKLAAKLGNKKAKVSMGLMLKNKKFLKIVDISKKSQNEYIKFSKEDKNFNFLKTIQQMAKLKSKSLRKIFMVKNSPLIKKYGKDCLKVLKKDLRKTDLKFKSVGTKMYLSKIKEEKIWAYIEGISFEKKEKKMMKAIKKFTKLKNLK